MAPDSLLALDRVELWSVALLLALAAGGSALAARIYLASRGDHLTGTHLYRAAPIIGLAFAALLVTVQFSLPLSLGLLAALTLVRVRTPLKEPEELALVMLIAAVAVSVASLKLGFLGGLLLAGLAAALCTRRISSTASTVQFTHVTILLPPTGAAEAQHALDRGAATLGSAARLQAISSGPQGLRLEYHLPPLSSDRRDALSASLASTLASASVRVTEVASAADTDP